jgi:HTH-type transcriptional regulator / antitoxin MqsA
MSRFCLQCDDGTLLNYQTKDVLIEIRGESCIVDQVTGWHCSVCGEIEFSDNESSERHWDAIEALSNKAKKRDAALLARTRKLLKLTQVQAAALTGGGHNAFGRYERGEVAPILAVVNLFRLLNKHPELVKELANET